MSVIIAMAGKGGTGKTTLAGWAIKYLLDHGNNPILAVDGDSNSNLNDVLGLEIQGTLGEVLEEMKRGGQPVMTKDIFVEKKVREILIETEGYDLLVMGRPKGTGCYCLVNNLLADIIRKLLESYTKVVIDNQAGMEHLSRLTIKAIDILYVVSDPSRRGLDTARRICDLVDELQISVGSKHLILNRVRGKVNPEILAQIQKEDFTLAGIIPDDHEVYHWDKAGKATSEINLRNPAVAAAFDIFAQTLADEMGAF